ncbi:MAG: hypothetical protein FJX77_17775, partial [Armatimonadetes bacterium]|nr:hypothetical protein [Armatimonadota bacterium]
MGQKRPDRAPAVRRPTAIGIMALAALLGAAGATIGRELVIQLGQQPDGSSVVPTNQRVTPVGRVESLAGARPKDVAFSPDGKTVAVLATGRVAFYTVDGAPAGQVSLTTGALGVAFSPDGGVLYASTSAGKVARFRREGESWKADGELTVDPGGPAAGRRGRSTGNPQAGGLAVSRDGGRLYVALGIRNIVAVVELPTGRILQTVPVGIAPYHVALTPDGRTLCVSNRGGPLTGDSASDTAPSAQTPVPVDPVTDAARQGSVSLIDTQSFAVRSVAVGRQPGGLAVTPDGRSLWVANSDSDNLSCVDLASAHVKETVSLRPPEDPGFGQMPASLALSEDGRTLYVACGGANAVAVLSVRGEPRLQGFLPCGWYPIALQERGGMLCVANTKGIGARNPNSQGKFGVHASVGTVQFVTAEQRRGL